MRHKLSMTPLVTSATIATVDGRVTRNGEAETRPELASAKAFLLAYPCGVYTCARAIPVEQNSGQAADFKLVIWAFHLERLARGLRTVWTDACPSTVRAAHKTTTQLMTDLLSSTDPARATRQSVMASVLWWLDRDEHDGRVTAIHINAHVCAMPQLKAFTANVLVHGNPRSNGICKDSSWIRERCLLEEHMKDIADAREIPLHESVLSAATPRSGNGDRQLLEGLITNFFIVSKGRVFTAPEGPVLGGSTRELVLRACKELEIPVVLEPPVLSDVSKWEAAFITSSVRIVVPVTRVLWHPDVDSDLIEEVEISTSSSAGLLDRLRDHIFQRWLDWE